jgi:hypothetical protein
MRLRDSAVRGGELVNRHCANSDDVPWELIPQLQTRAQSIDKAPMPRFRPPVDLHEEMFMLLQTARTVCHRTLHWVCSKGMSLLGGKWFKRSQARIGWDTASVQNLREPRRLRAPAAIDRQPIEISSKSMKLDADERAACARFAGG